MDIASVYLNLASLLDTEIEVEGYYEWGEIRSLEYDRQSLSVVLPRYVWDQGLTTINHALSIKPWVKLTVRGHLRQNQRGDPILDPIHSIIYNTDDIHYRSMFIYDEDSITCDMRGDLIFNQSIASTSYTAFKNTFFAYKFMSKPLLIESPLIPPHGIGGMDKYIGFSITLDGLVLDCFDLVRQSFRMLFYFAVMAPLILLMNAKNIRTIIPMIWGTRLRYQSVILIRNEENTILTRYLGRSGDQYKQWEGKVKFLFAGQLRRLEDEKRKTYLPKHVMLTFASLDSIEMTKTITFPRPQDE